MQSDKDIEHGAPMAAEKKVSGEITPAEGSIANTFYVDPAIEKSLVRKLDLYLLPVLAIM